MSEPWNLTEWQRRQFRETHARTKVEAYGRSHNTEPGIRCWCSETHVAADPDDIECGETGEETAP